MKIIEYDPDDYEIIDTIEHDNNDLFQKVRFKSGHYGVIFITTDNNTKYYDIIFISPNKDDTYVNLFLEFARNQTEIINKIHEKVDEVKLIVQLDTRDSEIFEELISKDEANDLLERLKITNEIAEIRKENEFISFDTLSVVLFICIIINLLSVIWNFTMSGV